MLTQSGRLGSLFRCYEQQLSQFLNGSALYLLVLWILTNDTDLAFSLDNLAFLANRFNRRSDFHVNPPFVDTVNKKQTTQKVL